MSETPEDDLPEAEVAADEDIDADVQDVADDSSGDDFETDASVLSDSADEVTEVVDALGGDPSRHVWGGDWQEAATETMAADEDHADPADDVPVENGPVENDQSALIDDAASGNDVSEPLEPPVDPHATIFQPSRPPIETTVPPQPVTPAADPTVFAPSPFPKATGSVSGVDPSAPAEETPAPGLTFIAPAVVSSAERVEVGAVLNGLYEVTRFIARGGMGEVWEGRNINDEHDRVAIKVVLPSLAADPNVQAMFRKEARTLKRLTHKAVVQYRVIASDPRLNILYIVTDFVDGVNLADAMPTLKPDAGQLRALLIRLAEGLRAAHEIGAIHRDMSPDNVILEDARIDGARIIDFGVAKDLDAAKGTIVGDGFAGKLGFVAPEQFGDFGRDVGPWTDVYSLGLVILAVAAGRNPDMGATLVDAVDRRRQGVDVSVAPDALRPVLAAMLAANPADRLRSMDAVLEALAGGMTPSAAQPEGERRTDKRVGRAFGKRADGPAAAAGASRTVPPGVAHGDKRGEPKGIRGWLADPRHRLIAFGAGGLAVVAAGALTLALVLGGTGGEPTKGVADDTVVLDGVAVGRAVEAALGAVPCSWMDVDALETTDAGVALRLSGAAGDVAAAQTAVERAVAGTMRPVSDLDMTGVMTTPTPLCAAVDALRPLRVQTSVTARRLTAAQTVWAMERLDGGPMANPVLDLKVADETRSFLVLGIDVDGRPIFISEGRQQLKTLAQAGNRNAQDLGGDAFRISFPMTEAGTFAVVLLIGPTPLMPDVLKIPQGDTGPWLAQFRSAAQEAGWTAEISWQQVTPAA